MSRNMEHTLPEYDSTSKRVEVEGRELSPSLDSFRQMSAAAVLVSGSLTPWLEPSEFGRLTRRRDNFPENRFHTRGRVAQRVRRRWYWDTFTIASPNLHGLEMDVRFGWVTWIVSVTRASGPGYI